MKDSGFTLNVYGNSLGECEDIALSIYDYLHTAKGTTTTGFSFGKILVQQLGSFTSLENYYSVLNLNFQYRSKQEQ
jgi:alpha/beta superfamily hydrolase